MRGGRSSGSTDDEIRHQPRVGGVIDGDLLDQSINCVCGFAPKIVTGGMLVSLEMVSHPVRRPCGVLVLGTVTQKRSLTFTTHRRALDAVGDYFPRLGQIIDIPARSPLMMGQQERVCDIHIAVSGAVLIFGARFTFVYHPGHVIGIVLAAMLVEHIEHPVEVLFSLAVITRYQSEDDHTVAMRFGRRYLIARASRSLHRDIISPARSYSIRLPDISFLPVVVMTLDGIIHVCLGNIVRFNAPGIGKILRKGPVGPTKLGGLRSGESARH